MNMVQQFDEALRRIDIALGNNPEDGCFSLGEQEAVALLDQLTTGNRKAILHVAAVYKSTDINPDTDFMIAAARLHRADPDAVLYAWGWTPAPGTKMNAQQTVALKLSQYLILFYEWKLESGALVN